MDGMVTLRGRVGSDMSSSRTRNGTPTVRFRLAVSQWRRTDDGGFEDLGARWYTIRAWGKLAQYTLASVRKGDPVVLVGRPAASAWTNPAGEVMSDLVITAHAIGHDLSYGTTTFFKSGGQAPALDDLTERTAETQPLTGGALTGGAPIGRALTGGISVETTATPEGSEFHVPFTADSSEETSSSMVESDQVEGAFHNLYGSEELAANDEPTDGEEYPQTA